MRAKLTIEQMQTLAKKHDGVCLSTVYVNNRASLRWRCANGHEWEATADHVKHEGTWCPVCAGSLRGTIEQMQALAKERNGQCISTTYVNNRTKLRWRCVEGHEWEARPGNIKQKQWCPACARKLRLTLDEMQLLARTYGGECLSSRYINIHTKLRWRCRAGHEWDAEPASVKSGGWCPTCGEGNSERIVRDICEQLFGKQFPKARPTWLTNSRGNRMELDGYCKEISLAFEYHGEYHYAHSSFFYRKRAERRASSLDQRKKDDVRKRRLCKKNGVHVIEIPYTVALVDVPAYVFRNVKNLGVVVSMRPPDTIKVARFVLPEKLRSMQVLAKERDGECLSTEYINALTALRWRCADGHTWQATPNNIRNHGRWCPVCAGNTPNTIEQMQVLARERHGECLSSKYVNAHTKLRWRCQEGHEWEATPGDVKNGRRWCMACSGRQRLTIEQMQALAKAHGGVCLSKRYIDSKTNLRWRCSEEHEWEAMPNGVQQGQWCPACAGNLRDTIEQMQALAQERDGVCLSTEYVNGNTKLRWRCVEGHEWDATPASVKRGHWCAACAGLLRGTIEECQLLAQSHDGVCLSTVYVNSKAKLRWRCAEGHEWEASPSSVKNNGSWCHCH